MKKKKDNCLRLEELHTNVQNLDSPVCSFFKEDFLLPKNEEVQNERLDDENECQEKVSLTPLKSMEKENLKPRDDQNLEKSVITDTQKEAELLIAFKDSYIKSELLTKNLSPRPTTTLKVSKESNHTASQDSTKFTVTRNLAEHCDKDLCPKLKKRKLKDEDYLKRQKLKPNNYSNLFSEIIKFEANTNKCIMEKKRYLGLFMTWKFQKLINPVLRIELEYLFRDKKVGKTVTWVLDKFEGFYHEEFIYFTYDLNLENEEHLRAKRLYTLSFILNDGVNDVEKFTIPNQIKFLESLHYKNSLCPNRKFQVSSNCYF